MMAASGHVNQARKWEEEATKIERTVRCVYFTIPISFAANLKVQAF
jgi:hypothetical protein